MEDPQFLFTCPAANSRSQSCSGDRAVQKTDSCVVVDEAIQEGTLLKILVSDGSSAVVEQTIAIIGGQRKVIVRRLLIWAKNAPILRGYV